MCESRLSFQDFLSIVICVYSEELQQDLRQERRNRLAEMVFGNMDGLDNATEAYTRLQNLRAANCIKVLGSGVIRVVHRVDDAKENKALDLSDCQLIQVPDAVYFMMKNTILSSCNLSFNVITKIPSKFPTTFSNITDLNLSHNRMSNLPDEIGECKELERIDISHNSFISIPMCLFAAPKLREINARKNFVADIEIDFVKESEKLEELNLEENPLSRPCLELLSIPIENINIKFTTRELEEWEDLSI